MILFCRSWLPGSYLIRALTFSRWSHAVLVKDGMAIEAVWPRVRKVPVEQIIKSHPDHAYADIPVDWDWAETQVGKPYDLGGLVAFFGDRDWASEDKWFCSELVAAAANRHTPIFRDSGRITPEMLWLVSK